MKVYEKKITHVLKRQLITAENIFHAFVGQRTNTHNEKFVCMFCECLWDLKYTFKKKKKISPCHGNMSWNVWKTITNSV